MSSEMRKLINLMERLADLQDLRTIGFPDEIDKERMLYKRKFPNIDITVSPEQYNLYMSVLKQYLVDNNDLKEITKYYKNLEVHDQYSFRQALVIVLDIKLSNFDEEYYAELMEKDPGFNTFYRSLYPER